MNQPFFYYHIVMNRRTVEFVSILLMIFSFMASCVSIPTQQKAKNAIAFLLQKDIINGYFGNSFAENPYMEPVSVVRGRINEFIIIKYSINVQAESEVTISAYLKNKNGAIIGKLATKNELIEFWKNWQNDPVLNKQRTLNIEQTYIPDFSFIVSPGMKEYYAVIIGKFPFERPAIVHAEMQIENQDPLVVDIELPDPAIGRQKSLF